MKFARRAEGIKSARTVFKRAREDQRCRHHVYVAAALMEYYCTKDKNIAFRIFELGLKKFADNPDYILCYIDYLSHLNGTAHFKFISIIYNVSHFQVTFITFIFLFRG
jgi:cleavage stimulation factor subunit 3